MGAASSTTNAKAELLGQYRAKRESKAQSLSAQEKRQEKRANELLQNRGANQQRQILEAALDTLSGMKASDGSDDEDEEDADLQGGALDRRHTADEKIRMTMRMPPRRVASDIDPVKLSEEERIKRHKAKLTRALQKNQPTIEAPPARQLMRWSSNVKHSNTPDDNRKSAADPQQPLQQAMKKSKVTKLMAANAGISYAADGNSEAKPKGRYSHLGNKSRARAGQEEAPVEFELPDLPRRKSLFKAKKATGNVMAALEAMKSAVDKWKMPEGDDLELQAARPIGERGVTVRWIVRFYHHCCDTFPERGNTFTVNDVLSGVVAPAVERHGCPFVYLPNVEMGEPTALVTCAPGRPFVELVASLKKRFKKRLDTPVWLDMFATESDSGVAEQLEVFSDLAESMQQLVVVADPAGDFCCDPWCLLAAAHAGKSRTSQEKLEVLTVNIAVREAVVVGNAVGSVCMSQSLAVNPAESLVIMDHADSLLQGRLEDEFDVALKETLCRALARAVKAASGAADQTKETLGKAEQDVIRSHILYAARDFDGAQAAAEHALAVRLEALGPSHALVARTYNHLASVAQAKLDYAGAEELYRKAICAAENLVGTEDDESLFPLYLNTAEVLYKQPGKESQAQEFFDRCLAVHGKGYKATGDEAMLIQPLKYMSLIARDTGDLAAAVAHLSRAQQMQERKTGAQSPENGELLQLLGGFTRLERSFEKATDCFAKVVRIRELHSPDSMALAGAFHNLAGAQKQMGDLDQSELSYRRSLAILKKHCAPGHHHVKAETQKLIAVLVAKGDHEAADILRMDIGEDPQGTPLREKAAVEGSSSVPAAITIPDGDGHEVTMDSLQQDLFGDKSPEKRPVGQETGSSSQQQAEWAPEPQSEEPSPVTSPATLAAQEEEEYRADEHQMPPTPTWVRQPNRPAVDQPVDTSWIRDSQAAPGTAWDGEQQQQQQQLDALAPQQPLPRPPSAMARESRDAALAAAPAPKRTAVPRPPSAKVSNAGEVLLAPVRPPSAAPRNRAPRTGFRTSDGAEQLLNHHLATGGSAQLPAVRPPSSRPRPKTGISAPSNAVSMSMEGRVEYQSSKATLANRPSRQHSPFRNRGQGHVNQAAAGGPEEMGKGPLSDLSAAAPGFRARPVSGSRYSVANHSAANGEVAHLTRPSRPSSALKMGARASLPAYDEETLRSRYGVTSGG